jgi:membrane protease subunit HflK
MPWSNQGGSGGPWGGGSGGSGGSGGGGGPWGRGPGGGPTPPNLEDVLRQGQDRLRSILPGGIGGGRGLILILIAVAILWAASGLYRVQPDEQGVELVFGQWKSDPQTTGPGLHWNYPWPIGQSLTPSVETINSIEIGYNSVGQGRGGRTNDVPEESLMLTGDQNIIDIDFSVQWKIKNAGLFLFNIRDPAATVKVAAESAMREVIGQIDIQPALTEARGQVQQDTQLLLQQMLDTYEAGIEITQVQLQDVQPPEAVIDAFDDVQRALQDRDRLQNEADAYRNDIIPRARGEAVQVVQNASAYREKVINEAQGDAARFLSVYQEYLAAKDVTVQRMYLETMADLLKDTEKMIIDSGAEGDLNPVPYLPLPQLNKAIDRGAANTGPEATQ